MTFQFTPVKDALTKLRRLQAPFRVYDKYRVLPKAQRIPLDFEDSKAPIFIVGHFRSGTTYLHNILSKNPTILYQTVHTTMNADSYYSGDKILYNHCADLIPSSRGFDNIPITMDSPNEDVMLTMDKNSLLADQKRAFWNSEYIFWLKITYNSKFDLVESSRYNEWKIKYKESIQKLIYYHNMKRGEKYMEDLLNMYKPRVVLKSPSHSGRIPLLLDIFPNAKFINIHRNPLDVIPSYINLMKYSDKQRENEIKTDDEYFKNAINGYSKLMNKYLDDVDIKQIFHDKPNQFAEIAFNDLMNDPVNTLEKCIINDLGINNLMCEEMRSYINDQQHSHIRNQYEPLTRDQIGIIRNDLGFAFERWGYCDNEDIPR